MKREFNNASIVRARRANTWRRKAAIAGLMVCFAGVIVLIILLARPTPPPSQTAQKPNPTLESEAPDIVTPATPRLPTEPSPEETYLGRGYILLSRTDAKGNRVTQKVTIEELIDQRIGAMIMQDAFTAKRLDIELMKLGDRVVEDLYVVMLAGKKLPVRQAAAGTLGRMDTDKAVEALWKYLTQVKEDDTPAMVVAGTALFALAHSRNARAEEYLIDLTGEQYCAGIRRGAVSRLGARFLNSEKTCKRLQDLLLNEVVRAGALEGLKTIALESEKAALRKSAVEGMAKIVDASTVAALKEIVEKSKDEDLKQLARTRLKELEEKITPPGGGTGD